MGLRREKIDTFAIGMNEEQLEILLSDEVRQAIHQNRGCDIERVALSKHIPHAAVVATQLKYLKRAETKLPSYASAECIIPPRAFEQSSSELSAYEKPLKGEQLLDLTCGLGVDAFALSRNFKRVVALERDPILAAVTRENFHRLGVENIEVICSSAEDYLHNCKEHFDWIFADPDRRNSEGRKMVCLEECSPNILALMGDIERCGHRLALKNSPMFDVAEARRLFPDSLIEVVSLGDECKEVMIYTGAEEPTLAANSIGRGRVVFRESELHQEPNIEEFQGDKFRYLVIPDVALLKARLTIAHLSPHCYTTTQSGFAFATDKPEGILGRVEEILHIEPFNPKSLKRELKGEKAEILKRDFPLSIEEIRKRCQLKDGCDIRLAFTRIGGDFWTIWLKNKR